MAEGGSAFIYQYGVGLGFPATVRPDGGPRVHAFTPEDVDDEFLVAGVARPVDDPDRRAAAVAAYHTAVKDDYRLFEFVIDRALLARYAARGADPTNERWRSRSLRS
jgi:hypothetical protein